MTSGLLDFSAYIPYLALVLRVWMGANFLGHGYPMTRNMKKTIEVWKQDAGVPAGAIYTQAFLQLGGGIFLIIGLIVPIISLFFAIFMISVAFVRRKQKFTYLQGRTGHSYEINVLYFLLSITLIVIGAGAFSIDQLIGF